MFEVSDTTVVLAVWDQNICSYQVPKNHMNARFLQTMVSVLPWALESDSRIPIFMLFWPLVIEASTVGSDLALRSEEKIISVMQNNNTPSHTPLSQKAPQKSSG